MIITYIRSWRSSSSFSLLSEFHLQVWIYLKIINISEEDLKLYNYVQIIGTKNNYLKR